MFLNTEIEIIWQFVYQLFRINVTLNIYVKTLMEHSFCLFVIFVSASVIMAYLNKFWPAHYHLSLRIHQSKSAQGVRGDYITRHWLCLGNCNLLCNPVDSWWKYNKWVASWYYLIPIPMVMLRLFKLIFLVSLKISFFSF